MENKLQKIARTLGKWIIASKGEERNALVDALALVTQTMGEDLDASYTVDPVFWFDKKGRLCTRAKTPEEIRDSMTLMAIAEGICLDDVYRKDKQWTERMKRWDAFQEMKLKYLEERMRVDQLEEELMEEKERNQQNPQGRRIADVDHIKKLVLLAMKLAGKDSITKEALEYCLDKAPALVSSDHDI